MKPDYNTRHRSDLKGKKEKKKKETDYSRIVTGRERKQKRTIGFALGTAGPSNCTPGTCTDTDTGTMERGSKQPLDVSSHTGGKYQLGCVHRQTPPRVVTETTQTGEVRRQIKQSKLINNRFKVTHQCGTLKNSVVGRDHLPAQTQFGDKDGSPHVTTQTVHNCREVH